MKHIAVTLLFGVYSLILAHNIIPHCHGEDFCSDDSIHVHDKDNHCHNHEPSSNSWMDIIVELLGDVEHVNKVDTDFNEYFSPSKKLNSNNEKVDAKCIHQSVYFILGSLNAQPNEPVHFGPPDVYLLTGINQVFSHRGPPAIC